MLTPPPSHEEILGGGELHSYSRKSFAIFSLCLWLIQDESEDGLQTGSVSLGTLVVHPQEGKTSLRVVFITTQKTHHCGTWAAQLWLGIWAIRYKTSDQISLRLSLWLFRSFKNSLYFRGLRGLKASTDTFFYPLLQYRKESKFWREDGSVIPSSQELHVGRN